MVGSVQTERNAQAGIVVLRKYAVNLECKCSVTRRDVQGIMVHKQQNEVKHSFNSANKYTDERRCKRHREGLCSYTKRDFQALVAYKQKECAGIVLWCCKH